MVSPVTSVRNMGEGVEMIGMGRGLRFAIASRVRRTNACDFKGDDPFIFRCNANVERCAWTPQLLKEKLGVVDFGRMMKVHVMLNGSNDEDVCSLVSWWTEYGYPVAIKFPVQLREPHVGSADSPFCFGVPRGEAFEKVGGSWSATKTLVEKVLNFFADNHLVIVN